MLKELRMLLSLRAWWKSTALKAGGLVGVLGAIQTYLGTKDGTDLMLMAASVLHLMPATLGGIFTMAIGLLIWILRAKAEVKLSDLAKEDTPAADGSAKNSGQHGYVQLSVLYVLIMLSVMSLMAFVVG